MIDPLALALLHAKRAALGCEPAPTGVGNPAMAAHRAEAAWVAAGCPVEDAPYRPDLVCPGCGGGVAWNEITGNAGATGRAGCLADEIATYKIRPGEPVVVCGWTGRVVRREDGEVEIQTQEPR